MCDYLCVCVCVCALGAAGGVLHPEPELLRRNLHRRRPHLCYRCTHSHRRARTRTHTHTQIYTAHATRTYTPRARALTLTLTHARQTPTRSTPSPSSRSRRRPTPASPTAPRARCCRPDPPSARHSRAHRRSAAGSSRPAVLTSRRRTTRVGDVYAHACHIIVWQLKCVSCVTYVRSVQHVQCLHRGYRCVRNINAASMRHRNAP